MIDFIAKYGILISMNDVLNDLKNWSDKVENVMNRGSLPENSEDIISGYFRLSLNLLSDEDTPPDVVKFLLSDTRHDTRNLPDEYKPLSEINSFYGFIKTQYESVIKEALSKDDFSSAAMYLSDAVMIDVKNVELFNLVSEEFIKKELYKDLIELYKSMFIYTVNPDYFEKMGDVYMLQEDYNAALDAYLNCAEGSDETVQLYEKLADVFGKINDNESRLACLEHIKVIEAENGK